MKQVEEKAFDQEVELKIIKAVTLADQGCNHECVRELDKIMAANENRSSGQQSGPARQLSQSNINNINNTSNISNSKKDGNHDSNTSDQLLQMRMNLQGHKAHHQGRRHQFCLLMKSIIQRKIGEHEECVQTATECINKFPEFKDAYLVRGQINLLQKKSQKAVQDFLEFNGLAAQEMMQMTQAVLPIPNGQAGGNKHQKIASNIEQAQCLLRISIGKESLGDAYKKMKKYKLANQCYEESVGEISKIKVTKNQNKSFSDQVGNLLHKVKLKIAMCAYYQGDMHRATAGMQDVMAYYKGFDFETLKVQQKLIKVNFYLGKAILSQIG